MTDENYFCDLRDSSLYVAGATSEQASIPAQPKLYLSNQREYVAGLQKIHFPLERVRIIPIWRQGMEEDLSSGYDYELESCVGIRA